MLKVIGFHEFLHGSADPRNIDDRKPEIFKLTVDVNSILSFQCIQTMQYGSIKMVKDML